MADWQIERNHEGKYLLNAVGLRPMLAVIGKAGLIAGNAKCEGDMATPVGRWTLRRVYYRKDLLGKFACELPSIEITPHCGWCDDPSHHDYNCKVDLPFSGSHECMWRDDGAYDLVVVLGFNDAPPVVGRGSAIFLHCIAPGATYTAGCVALARSDLLAVLQSASANQHLNIDVRLLT